MLKANIPHMLQRKDAKSLDDHLSRVSDLGPCFEGASVLEQVPNKACVDLYCLQSTRCDVAVDLASHLMLQQIPSPANVKCSVPSGGQVRSTNPVQLSIIIAVRGNSNQHIMQATYCLLELFRTASEASSAEFLIVIDDSSNSEDSSNPLTAASGRAISSAAAATVVLLDTVQRLITFFDAPIKVSRHSDSTRGFNIAGARQASGTYLAVVDSGVLVSRGMLTTLLATMEAHTDAGLVGPLLLQNRGKGMQVAHAGGVLWADGAAHSLSRGVDVDHEVQYLRQPDYVTPGVLLMRRQAFLDVGGLDARFGLGPYGDADLAMAMRQRGYQGPYGDADLAMAMRQRGYQVLYQPSGVAYQLQPPQPNENLASSEAMTPATGRTDPISASRRRAFVDKWSPVLTSQHCPAHKPDEAAARSRHGPALLWVDGLVPEPDHDSGSVRSFAMLKILLDAGYDVSFMPMEYRMSRYRVSARHLGVDVLAPYANGAAFAKLTMKKAGGGGGCPFDAIILAHRYVFELIGDAVLAACPHIPFIYDTVDLHFLRETRSAITSSPGFTVASLSVASVLSYLSVLPADHELRKNQDYELNILRRSNVTLVVSEDEVALLSRLVPEVDVHVVSNIHTPNVNPAPCEERSGVLFVGSFEHTPNRQAVRHLLADILPAVLTRLPRSVSAEFKVHIVGSAGLPEDLKPLIVDNARHVVFHDWLSDADLLALYGKVKISVAPLLSGAGVKGKVNQAMKHGVPVVATSMAMEGMHLHNGTEALVGDGAGPFADQLVELYTNCQLWQRLANAGVSNIKHFFSPTLAKADLLSALVAAGFPPKAASAKHC
ncbi:MAG: hypothetical protein WDW36_000928 [Sanguina aurantia]